MQIMGYVQHMLYVIVSGIHVCFSVCVFSIVVCFFCFFISEFNYEGAHEIDIFPYRDKVLEVVFQHSEVQVVLYSITLYFTT